MIKTTSIGEIYQGYASILMKWINNEFPSHQFILVGPKSPLLYSDVYVVGDIEDSVIKEIKTAFSRLSADFFHKLYRMILQVSSPILSVHERYGENALEAFREKFYGLQFSKSHDNEKNSIITVVGDISREQAIEILDFATEWEKANTQIFLHSYLSKYADIMMEMLKEEYPSLNIRTASGSDFTDFYVTGDFSNEIFEDAQASIRSLTEFFAKKYSEIQETYELKRESLEAYLKQEEKAELAAFASKSWGEIKAEKCKILFHVHPSDLSEVMFDIRQISTRKLMTYVAGPAVTHIYVEEDVPDEEIKDIRVKYIQMLYERI